MMLSFQVREMRAAIDRLVKMQKPPATVMILQGHAEHLGVVALNRNQEAVSSPLHDRDAVPYGPLVKVKLVDLYVALKTAKGVDEPEWGQSEAGSASNPVGET